MSRSVASLVGLTVAVVAASGTGCGVDDDAAADHGPSIGKGDDGAGAADLVLRAFDDVALDESGRSATLDLVVPDDAHGMNVTILGEPGSFYLVSRLEGPNGPVISDAPAGVELSDADRAGLWGQFLGPNPSGLGAVSGYGSVQVPNNPAVALTPGAWRLEVQGVGAAEGEAASGTVDVRVAIKRGPVPPTRGLLLVNLHFSGACGLTSTTWPGTVIDDVITVATNFMASAGIDLVIEQIDDVVTAPTYDVLAPRSGLEELFATSRHERGVDVYVVDIASQGIAGMSAGIPGAGIAPGSHGAGIALGCRPSLTTLGHELGHYLGLPHTAELDGSARDRLDDTDDRGLGNVMKPEGGNGAGTFSPQQAWVLHRNPVVITLP